MIDDDEFLGNKDAVLDGFFWEPEAPERRLHGVLRLSSDGDTLTLSLPEIGNFHEEQEELTKPIGRLYGMLEGRGEVTVVNASPTGGSRSNAYVTAIDFWQFTAIFGLHTSAESFRHLDLELEWLSEWTPNRRLVVPAHDDRLEVNVSSEILATADWDGVRLSLGRFVARTWSSNKVTARNEWSFRVDTEAAIADISSEWLGPLQDFLLIAMGYRPGVLRVRIGIDDERSHGRRLDVRPWWPGLGPSGASPRLIRFLPQTKTLLLPDDEFLPLAEALRTWFAKREEFRVVVSMLSAGLHNPHTALEHRFLSLFLAVDALARQTPEIEPRAVPTHVHDARVAAIASALIKSDVPEDIRSWAMGRVRDGNGKSQRAVLSEFLDITGLLASGKATTTAKSLNQYRTDIAHGGTIKGIDRDEVVLEVIHLAELMEWIVRAELLVNLGVPRASLQQRLFANSNFQEVVESRKWQTRLSSVDNPGLASSD